MLKCFYLPRRDEPEKISDILRLRAPESSANMGLLDARQRGGAKFFSA